MADCPSLSGCPFFNDKMANMPGTSAIIKRQFCQSDNSGCARFIVATACGKEKVPIDLFPNQKERAETILQGTK